MPNPFALLLSLFVVGVLSTEPPSHSLSSRNIMTIGPRADPPSITSISPPQPYAIPKMSTTTHKPEPSEPPRNVVSASPPAFSSSSHSKARAPSSSPHPKAATPTHAQTQNLRILTTVKPTTQGHPLMFTLMPSASKISVPIAAPTTATFPTFSNPLSSSRGNFTSISGPIHSNGTSVVHPSTVASFTSSTFHSTSTSVNPAPTTSPSTSNQLGATPHANAPSHGVVVTLIIFGVLASAIVLTFLWSKDKFKRFCGGEHDIGDEEFDSYAGKHGAEDVEKTGTPGSYAVSNLASNDGYARPRQGGVRGWSERKRIASHHLSISRPFVPGSRPHSKAGGSRSTWLGWGPRNNRAELDVSLPPLPPLNHTVAPPSIVVSAPASNSNHGYGATTAWPNYPSNSYIPGPPVNQGRQVNANQQRSAPYARHNHTESEIADPYSDYDQEERGSDWWGSGRRG